MENLPKDELPDLENYALKTDLENYALKTDLENLPKDELPDLENYALKTDLSNYALKTDLENLPKGGATNVTANEISKLLTMKYLVSYKELMDGRLVFVNDSDKPVTITVQQVDRTQGYPYQIVDKEYTFQPHEEWEYQFNEFEPTIQEGTYPNLDVKVDGEQIKGPFRNTIDPRWGLKSYLNPTLFMRALYNGLEYESNESNILTKTKLEKLLSEDYNFESYGIFKNLATKTYVDDKLVKPSLGLIYVYDGSTLKAAITPDKSTITGDRAVLTGSVQYLNGYSSLGKKDKYKVSRQIGSNIDEYDVTIESVHSVAKDNTDLEGFDATYAAFVVKFGYRFIRDVVLK